MSSQALLPYSVGIIQTKALPLQGGLNSHLSSARGCGFRDERVDEKEDREPGRYRGPPSHAEGGTGEPALESISAAQMYKVLGDS